MVQVTRSWSRASGMLSYAILKVLRNNRTLCFLVQGVHTVKRFSADISPFSLPYHGGSYTQCNWMPRVACRLCHSSVPLRFLNIHLRRYFGYQIYRLPNFAGFREYSDIRFRKNDKKLSLLIEIGSLKLIHLFILSVCQDSVGGSCFRVLNHANHTTDKNRALFSRGYGFFLLFVPVSKYWVSTGFLHTTRTISCIDHYKPFFDLFRSAWQFQTVRHHNIWLPIRCCQSFTSLL